MTFRRLEKLDGAHCSAHVYPIGFRATVCLIAWSVVAIVNLNAARAQEFESESTSNLSQVVPEWAGSAQYSKGKAVYYTIRTNPHPTRLEVERELNKEVISLVRRLALNVLDSQPSVDPKLLDNLDDYEFDIERIKRILVPNNRWTIIAITSPDPPGKVAENPIDLDSGFQGFAQIRIDDEFGELARSWAEEPIVMYRLGWAIMIAIHLFGSLVVLFLFLKLDKATRGHYSRRLQFLALTLWLMLAIAIWWIHAAMRAI